VKIVTIGDDGYIVLGKVSANTNQSSDELKSQYRLADTILRNGNELFICMKIIDVEFYDI
jgi:hypothetical protein